MLSQINMLYFYTRQFYFLCQDELSTIPVALECARLGLAHGMAGDYSELFIIQSRVYISVSTRTPSFVTTTVRSKWAARELSCVRHVHPSVSSTTL